MQVGGDLLEVTAGEVRSVVGIGQLRDAADRPRRAVLTPDRLPQGERRLQRRRRIEVDGVAGRGAAEVVKDHGQPRTRGPARRIHDEKVKLRVISLPDRVAGAGLAAQRQLEAVAVCGRASASRPRSSAAMIARVVA